MVTLCVAFSNNDNKKKEKMTREIKKLDLL